MEKSYKIEVMTGNIKDGGTDADVYIQLIGVKRTSPELKIDNKEDNFEQGKLDTFFVSTEDVGWIYRIRIFHNNKEKKAGWYLNYVKVTDQTTGLSWKVDFNRWLAIDEGDRRIDVTNDVPVDDNVNLSKGGFSTVYLGFNYSVFNNNSESPMSISRVFTYRYENFVSIDFASSVAITANVSLEASFFGFLNSKFSAQITSNVSKSLGTKESEILEMSTIFEYTLPPKTNITVACVYFQYLLDGTVYSNNIQFGFKHQFSLMQDIHVFNGIFSEQQVSDNIRDMIRASTNQNLSIILPGTILFKNNLVAFDKKHIEEAAQRNLSIHNAKLFIEGAQLIKTPFKQNIKIIK